MKRPSDIPPMAYRVPAYYSAARPSIIALIARDRRGQMYEVYRDQTRYPGPVLREIRRDGKHR